MGVILLLSIFSISLAVIYAGGIPSLQSSQSGASLQQVEQAFTALDSRLSKAALGESPSQTVTVDLAGGTLRLGNTSWMNITFTDSSGTLTGCINITLGTLEYVKDNRTVAYESGGLFARYPDGGQVLLSPPEFHYDGETLTLPLILLNGTGSRSGAGSTVLRIHTQNLPTVYFPNNSATGCGANTLSRVNPLQDATVYVAVHSDYWRAWAEAMRRQTGVTASTDDAQRLAIAKLGTETATQPFQQGVFAASSLTIHNSAAVKSYNSITTKCSDAAGLEGDVVAANSIELKNSASVKGNASTAGTVTIRNSAVVNGICKAASVVNEGDGCTGGIQGAASVSSMPSVDGTIAGKISEYSSPVVNGNAENGGSCCALGAGPCISDTDFRLNLAGSATCTLTTGQYYLNELDLGDSASLILDTSGGPIDIAVDFTGVSDKFRVGNSAKVEVQGNNNNVVNFYLDSGIKPDLANSGKLTLIGNGSSDNPAERNTSRLRVWLHSGSGEWSIENSARFTGVVYAPRNNIRVKNSGTVCGALIGYDVQLDNSQVVKFDTNLKNVQFFSQVPLVIQYLHLSGNRLNVTLG